jgi:sugar lactone lactonase YvrE
VILLLMLAMAAIAAGMNRQAGLQARMAANQTRSTQVHLGQIAALEEAAWTLNRNPTWRTSTAGKTFSFNGIDYTRKVLDSSIPGYEDVVTVTVTAPGGLKQLTTSFRLNPQTITFYLIADTENHRLRQVDTSTGIITTFAGTGTSGRSGEGGPATEAQFDNPRGICADQAGNVYIADTMNQRIMKVDPDGIATRVAGKANDGGYHDGDNGPATSAALNEPNGVAVDGLGNIYIADSKNGCIRKVDGTSAVITTVAGIPGSNAYSGDGGPATSAELNEPHGIAVDGSGNLFIADTGNCMIRKVDATTKTISRIAGATSGSSPSCGYSGDMGQATNAELSNPSAVYLDISGHIYIADTDNHRIRKVDATSQIITTVAGDGIAGYGGDGGPATSGSIQKPKGLWVDEAGSLLIADSENHRLRKVSASSETISTVAGDGTADYSGDGGPAIDASLKKPHGVCVYESPAPRYLHISDPSNYQIRKVDLDDSFLTKVAGTFWYGYNGDNRPATTARLNYPFGVHVGPSGNVYIADTYNHRIRRVDRTTGIITTVAGKGAKGFSGDGGPSTNARLKYPFSVYVDTYGNIYIADTYNHRIRKVQSATGIITTVAGDGHHRFKGDGGLATSASLDMPYDVAVDSEGNIFIADTNNEVIRKVDGATGIIDTVAGRGKWPGYWGDGGSATSALLNGPTGVCVDSAGNMCISDSNNNVVRTVDATTQIITTIAGTGTAGFSGDGGAATQARLDYPEGLWRDSSGDLYIVDTDNCRVRMVDSATGIISTVAGTTWCGYNGNDLPATDAALYYPSDVSMYEPFSVERVSQIYRPSN